MKMFFTDLTKLCLATILLTGIAIHVSAEEYKSMICYDRVREHISIHWNDRQVYHVRFDGTEEINGKTYHRLAAFRKASYDYDYDLKPYLFDIDENYYKHEGYLREEDGKVYTLIRNEKGDDEYCSGSLYVPSLDDPIPSDLVE